MDIMVNDITRGFLDNFTFMLEAFCWWILQFIMVVIVVVVVVCNTCRNNMMIILIAQRNLAGRMGKTGPSLLLYYPLSARLTNCVFLVIREFGPGEARRT